MGSGYEGRVYKNNPGSGGNYGVVYGPGGQVPRPPSGGRGGCFLSGCIRAIFGGGAALVLAVCAVAALRRK